MGIVKRAFSAHTTWTQSYTTPTLARHPQDASFFKRIYSKLIVNYTNVQNFRYVNLIKNKLWTRPLQLISEGKSKQYIQILGDIAKNTETVNEKTKRIQNSNSEPSKITKVNGFQLELLSEYTWNATFYVRRLKSKNDTNLIRLYSSIDTKLKKIIKRNKWHLKWLGGYSFAIKLITDSLKVVNIQSNWQERASQINDDFIVDCFHP